ncbi:MAG: RloB family protein [Ardenticatenaceae bacterium]
MAKRRSSRRKKGSKRQFGAHPRKNDRRNEQDRFLIVCEGTETEPNYFKSFRVPKKVKGTGLNTIGVVDEAIELKDKGNYDQVWCVFDKDQFPDHKFEQAIRKAKKHDIKVAYSNPSFELWFLLHFPNCPTCHTPKLCEDKLKQRCKNELGVEYKKNHRKMYELLDIHQSRAIKCAENLLKRYKPHRPAKDNPCTTVYCLVKELKKFEK